MFTLLSRISGLIRDRLLITAFDNDTKDAFAVAFKIPNLFRRLSAEGAFTAAFVPVLGDYLVNEDQDRTARFLHAVFTAMTLFLTLLSLGGIVLGGLIVTIYVPGFRDNPAVFSLTVILLRIMFGYILLISLASLLMGVVQSLGHFSSPAFSPVLLNLATIAGILFLDEAFPLPIHGAAVGVMIGGVLQLVLQVVVFRRWGYTLRFRLDLRDEGVRKIVRLMVPTLFGVAIYQINIMVTDFIGSFHEQVRLNWLYFANRIFQLPMGMFSVSVATVVLPELARSVSAGKREDLESTIDFALVSTLFLIVPTTAALLVLSYPLVSLIYFSGTVSAEDCREISRSIDGYTLGLFGVSFSAILTRIFYAFKDTKTPVMASTWSLGLNLGLGVILARSYATMGLALAVSLATYGNLLALWIGLRQHRVSLRLASLFVPCAKITVCTALMSVALWSVGWTWFEGVWSLPGVTTEKVLAMMVLLCVGGGLYLGSAWLLLRPQMRALVSKR